MRSLLRYYANAVMSGDPTCAYGCNGHGDCFNGTCLCEIRYTGDTCMGHNLPYHASIGGIFLVVAFVCAVQLTICVVSEYRRLKAPSFLRACKLTTQKLLYLVAFLASLIRGAYFVSPSAFEKGWWNSLLSAYYPLLLSACSLIVCFWAEVFHLRNIRWERPRFLSKSCLAFVTFNLIIYTLLVAEVLTTNVSDSDADKQTYHHVFYGCYAALLFIVVIFFLIYGVEVFFKLRGEFLKETKVCTIVSPRPGSSTYADSDDVQDQLVTKQGIQTDLSDGGAVDPRSVDVSQLHQSRVGLISQALMLILITVFLASETLSEWKTRVPVSSRNWYDVVFRLAEIGVTIWFPCVLWNSMAPERLWLLNPRRLLARQLDEARLADLLAHHQPSKNVETDSLVGSVSSTRDCWICYDSSRPEPLIHPCRCTGDVSAVHHECLRCWLVESAGNPDGLKCKVCNTPYIVRQTNRVEWERGFTVGLWVRTALCAVVVTGAVGAAWLVLQLCASTALRGLAAGLALIVCFVIIQYLARNTEAAYQRAKVSSLQILTESSEGQDAIEQGLTTISETVTVDIASKAVLDRALKGDATK